MTNKIVITVLFLTLYVTGFSQDFIIKKDGTKLEVKVLEISSTEVKYYNFTQPNGPMRILGTHELTEIIYENGEFEKFDVKEPIKPQNNVVAEQPRSTAKYAPLDMMGAGFAIDILIGGNTFSRIQTNNIFDPYQPTPQPQKITTGSSSFGFRLSNKWYFDATPKWRSGIQVSYIRMNFNSSYALSPFSAFSLSPLNFGTANIIKLNDHLGLEANMICGLTITQDGNSGYTYTGITLNPEVKLRYKVLAVGIDYSRSSQLFNNYHRLHQLSFSIGAKF